MENKWFCLSCKKRKCEKYLFQSKSHHSDNDHLSELKKIPKNWTYKYFFQDILGYGQFGIVFKVKDKLDKCLYAFKLMFEYEEAEIKILSRCCHSNIIRYFVTLTDENSGYWGIVTELADYDLNYPIERMNLSDEQKISYAIDLCYAVDYLHQSGVVHRDLKPGNILINNNKIKITDFGISKKRKNVDQEISLTNVTGTMIYLPPELIMSYEEDKKEVPHSSMDIWSLGIVLHKIFSQNKHPFERENGNIKKNIKNYNFEIHSEVEKFGAFKIIILGCLQKDPKKRLSSQEIIQILEKEKLGKSNVLNFHEENKIIKEEEILTKDQNSNLQYDKLEENERNFSKNNTKNKDFNQKIILKILNFGLLCLFCILISLAGSIGLPSAIMGQKDLAENRIELGKVESNELRQNLTLSSIQNFKNASLNLSSHAPSNFENLSLELFEKSFVLKSNAIDMKTNVEFLNSCFNKKIKSLGLLYRSLNSFNSEDFHEKCDNKGQNLVLIKAENQVSYGGFNSVSWKKEGKYQSAPGSFLFSLSKKLKFELQNNETTSAIYCSLDHGPTFGRGDFKVFQNKISSRLGQTYGDENNKIKHLSITKEIISFEILEIFSIKFDE